MVIYLISKDKIHLFKNNSTLQVPVSSFSVFLYFNFQCRCFTASFGAKFLGRVCGDRSELEALAELQQRRRSEAGRTFARHAEVKYIQHTSYFVTIVYYSRKY